MTFKPSDFSEFPLFLEQRPFIERLIDGLSNEGEADGYTARVRAAVALGLLPIEEIVRVNYAPGELDMAYLCTLQIRRVFTGEFVEPTNRSSGKPQPSGSYRHSRRDSTQL